MADRAPGLAPTRFPAASPPKGKRVPPEMEGDEAARLAFLDICDRGMTERWYQLASAALGAQAAVAADERRKDVAASASASASAESAGSAP